MENICNINPEYINWEASDQKIVQGRVKTYLDGLEKISLTFTLNQLQGTPSIILFNDQHEIIEEWFGHASFEDISEKIVSVHSDK